MNFLTYCENQHELGLIKEAGIAEAIFSCRELSRFAKTTITELNALINLAKKLEIRVVLEWDILVTEDEFESVLSSFKKIDLDLVSSIRVQDAGILEYVLEHTDKKIQFISETGNHNLLGLKTWVSYIGSRLERVVLSIELNKAKLSEYIEALGCPVEFLVMGRILLFYSPRKLLSTLSSNDDEPRFKQVLSQDYIEATGESEESPHKGFPLVENKHGTFMFHMKHLFLLDNIKELEQMNLTYARVDLRFDSEFRYLHDVVKTYETTKDFSLLKEEYKFDVIRGYFQVNKSNVLFKKLKNYRIQRKDASYVGEVIEALKGKYLAILIKSENTLKIDDQLKFITPEGREYSTKVYELKDTAGTAHESMNKSQLALINYMSGVWSKSQVYFQE